MELNWYNPPQCSDGVSLQSSLDTSTEGVAVTNEPTSRNRDTRKNMTVANLVREFPYFLDPETSLPYLRDSSANLSSESHKFDYAVPFCLFQGPF